MSRWFLLNVRHSSSLYFTGQPRHICSPLSPSMDFINCSIFQCNFNIIIQICSIVICLERRIYHTRGSWQRLAKLYGSFYSWQSVIAHGRAQLWNSKGKKKREHTVDQKICHAAWKSSLQSDRYLLNSVSHVVGGDVMARTARKLPFFYLSAAIWIANLLKSEEKKWQKTSVCLLVCIFPCKS